MIQHCSWLFGRGASIANGISWVVPIEWKRDLLEGRVDREEHKNLIINTVQEEMQKPSVHCKPYRKFLSVISKKTKDNFVHQLITTNWDYLLQLELTTWINTNQPGFAPGFLSTHSHVLHLNGSVEPGESPHRSPFLLETDSATYRLKSFEANKAFNLLLWSNIIIMVGLSFECDTDKGLLAALREHENNVPIGEALFVTVDPCSKNLENIMKKLRYCFPRSELLPINNGFDEWVKADMPELKGIVLNHNGL